MRMISGDEQMLDEVHGDALAMYGQRPGRALSNHREPKVRRSKNH